MLNDPSLFFDPHVGEMLQQDAAEFDCHVLPFLHCVQDDIPEVP
jgi:hypothetical protein